MPASARVHPSTGGAGLTGVTTTPSTSVVQQPGASTATQPTAPAATTPSTTVVVPGTQAPARTAKPAASSKLSTPAIVAVAIATLLALGCAVWGIARMQAFEPRWTLALRHAFAEAGFRASATWAEFGDWARLGR